jgi:hypothetical protein
MYNLNTKNLKNDTSGFDIYCGLNIINRELSKSIEEEFAEIGIKYDEEFEFLHEPKITILAEKSVTDSFDLRAEHIELTIKFKQNPIRVGYDLYDGTYKKKYEVAIEKIEKFLIKINSLLDKRHYLHLRSCVETHNILIRSINTGLGVSGSSYFMFSDIREGNNATIKEYIQKIVDVNQDLIAFDGLISINDAAKKYNKDVTVLESLIQTGKFVEGVDVMKFDQTWVFRENSLIDEYVYNY